MAEEKRDTAEHVYDIVKKEIKDLFGDVWDESKDDIKVWAETLINLRLERAAKGGSDDLDKDIEYAMAAIRALKHKLAGKVEDGIWNIVERALKLLARVLLTVAFAA